MKLIHVKQARSVWLFDIADLNPTGEDLTEDLIDWIKETYDFANGPDIKEVLAKAGTNNAIALTFQRGRFQTSEDLAIEIVNLTIHNDGIVVDTVSSTQEADRFAGELLESATKTFGLAYEPSMVHRRLYISTLIVKLDVDFHLVHPGLAAFAEKRIPEVLGNESTPLFQFAGIQFWSDPNDGGVHKTFSLMPQAGKPLSEHRYFSESPFTTQEHLRLLEDLEKLLAQP
jgi:hypothetical protein